ncbi:glycosyltransferase [Vibrio cyclitrophicus]|uniref:glycosyltransferase n=1 Tax=Vibrio cyclitrophicus TaxID=47951 RepID=UPI00080E98E2|nr:glycosyltransferase [Vibrio cyclitrophicus]OCH40306.1 hypothetical protein A6E07_10970 [Vibrio cyclitrophicus]
MKRKSVKYIFNCTTNVVGGAVQNSVNFIKSLKLESNDEGWYFFLTQEVFEQVSYILEDEQYEIFSSPAKSWTSRRNIRKLQEKLSPELVYTSAGPAYVNFSCYHIMGCSNPYILGANDYALNIINGFGVKILRLIHTFYQRRYIKLADYWIVQSNDSFNKMVNIGINREQCSVVNNAISKDFFEEFLKNRNVGVVANKSNAIKILVPSAYYSHKNLEIIPMVAKELKCRGYDAKFTLTVSESRESNRIFDKAESLNVKDCLVNIGPYKHSDALEIYKRHDMVFLPSLLEVFSTSYIESICLLKPLVVPDLDFARDICESYAVYYQPMSFLVAADSIIEANYQKINSELANSIIKKYGSQNERFHKILDLINSIKTEE